MKFKLEFDMDNTVFEDDPNGEAARILSGIGKHLREGWDRNTIVDENGNKIGKWGVWD